MTSFNTSYKKFTIDLNYFYLYLNGNNKQSNNFLISILGFQKLSFYFNLQHNPRKIKPLFILIFLQFKINLLLQMFAIFPKSYYQQFLTILKRIYFLHLIPILFCLASGFYKILLLLLLLKQRPLQFDDGNLSVWLWIHLKQVVSHSY